MNPISKQFKRINQIKLSEAVLNQLLGMLANGTFKPGDQLPSEPILSGELGVSRLTLREAIKVLETMGLIEIKRGRGTFVKDTPPGSLTRLIEASLTIPSITVLELLDARRLIEIETVARAALRRTDRDIVELSRILKEMENTIHEPVKYIQLDTSFHLKIASCANNRIMLSTLQMIRDQLRGEFERSINSPEKATAYCKDHRAIVEALKNRDKSRAVRIMVKHLKKLELEIGDHD